jgi:hypothetical protein
MREQMTGSHRGRASAPGGAGFDLLFFPVVEQEATVLMPVCDIDSILLQELIQQIRADHAEISGQDQIVFLRPRAGIFKKGLYRGGRRRRHRRPILF